MASLYSWPYQLGSTAPAAPPAGGTGANYRRLKRWWGPNPLILLLAFLLR